MRHEPWWCDASTRTAGEHAGEQTCSGACAQVVATDEQAWNRKPRGSLRKKKKECWWLTCSWRVHTVLQIFGQEDLLLVRPPLPT